jgi:membrane protein YqaA with SNARE-associated domain
MGWRLILFRPWLDINTLSASLVHRISWLTKLSGTKRRLLVAVIVTLIILLSYAVFRLSLHLEGFEQYGYLGAFLVAFISSITIIFPIPGIIVIVAIAVNPDFNWALVAVAAALGGALGESTAYLAGYGGVVVIAPEQSIWYKRAENWMRRYGSATIFAFSLTWLPFDIVGIAAGALRFPFWKFLMATIAGRLPRTLLECYLAYLGWGILSRVEWWSGWAWWSWVIIGVCLAVSIGGIVLIWRHRRAQR